MRTGVTVGFDTYGSGEDRLAVRYGITETPYTVLIDRDGRMLHSGLRGEDLERAIKMAL